MQFSLWPINQQPLDAIVDLAHHVEADGWDGVWMADHLMPAREPLDQPVVECWTALTAIAATIPRIRVGSLVLSNTFRHPGVLAKMAGTLASAWPGRLVLGIGAGWQANEHTALGIPLAAPARRLAALDEACHVLRRLLDDGEVSHAGAHLTIDGAVCHPVPSERVPLLLGLKGDRALRLVARHADLWNLWATPATLLERSHVLERHCEAVGRDPASITRTAQAIVAFTDQAPLDRRWAASGMPLLTGSTDEIVTAIGEYRAAGLDELIVPDFALGTGSQRVEILDRFWREVVPAFRPGHEHTG